MTTTAVPCDPRHNVLAPHPPHRFSSAFVMGNIPIDGKLLISVQDAKLPPDLLDAARSSGAASVSVCCSASVVDSNGLPLPEVEEQRTSAVTW